MIRRLMLCLPLVLAVSCTKKSDSGPDLNTEAGCMNAFPASAGRPVHIDQISGKRRLRWVLVKADVFQSLYENGNSQFIGYSISPDQDSYSVNRVCGGGEVSNVVGGFNVKIPASIGGRGRRVTSYVRAQLSALPDKILSHDTETVTADDDLTFTSSQEGAEHKITMINDSTLEIWAKFPANEQKWFVFRATYRAVAATNLDLFKEAYSYAYSKLNLSAQDARRFASDVSARGVDAGAKYLDSYEEVYSYVYSKVDLNRESSMQYAQVIAATEDPDKSFDIFKRSYEYAYSSSGLNLPREEALKFAAQQAHLKI